MLRRVPTRVFGAPRWRLAGAAVVFVAAVVFGAPGVSQLSSGGFVDSASPSARADAILARDFPGSSPGIFVLVQCAQGAGSPAGTSTGRSIVRALQADRDISAVTSYWSRGSAGRALLGADGKSALITATVSPGATDRTAVALRWQHSLESAHRPVGTTVRVFSGDLTNREITEQTKRDFEVAELVTLPVTAMMLLLVFGSLVAALIPLLTGVLAIASTLAILRLIAGHVQVSVFALNLTTGLGLALAIDYSLLLVSRYREERRQGRAGADAVDRTMATAGRTVLLSACIVMLSLASLAIFPLDFLRSFAYAGSAVVVFDAACALLVTPALLSVLGQRIGRLGTVRPRDRTVWYRSAAFAMRHAVPVLALGVVVLVALALPFAGVTWGPPDDRLLPVGTTARQVGDVLRRDFPRAQPDLVIAVIPDRRTAGDTALARYAAELSRIPHVQSVTATTGLFVGGRRTTEQAPDAGMGRGTSTYLAVDSTVDPLAPAAGRILAAARSVQAPLGTLLTGPVARNADQLQALGGRLPLALLAVAASTMVVVFMLTGSLVLPLKAVLMTGLSLTATFGALVWVFQDGHLLGWISATPATGFMVAAVPILMFCMAFGMSMDYEVFLLARICEERARVAGRARNADRRAVRNGLAASGRIVSAAALLMGTVFAGLMTSRLPVIQMFGLGLLLFVVLDATLIRGLLLPAFMRIAGPGNWWAPSPLRRWHGRHGWSDGW